MRFLVLLGLVLATEPRPDGGVAPAPIALSLAECRALAEHGFDLYVKDLKSDPGIVSEMEGLSGEERAAYLKEVKLGVTADRGRYVSEATRRCLEVSGQGKVTNQMVVCAKAATSVLKLEKCLGQRLRGEAL